MTAHAHHHHPPSPESTSRAFVIGISLNLIYVLVEAWYGWKTGSLALLADAGHNFSDVIGLVLAWAGAAAARLRPMSAIPMAGNVPASWRPSSMPCCC